MAEQVVIEFGVDTTQLNKAIDLMESLGQVTKEDADKFRKANEDFKKAGQGLASTASGAKQAADNLNKVGDAGRKAGDGVKAGADKAGKSIFDLKGALKDIAGTIGVAFAVHKVIEFGVETAKAFQEAQKNAALLQSAVGINGGLAEDFEALIDQSAELQAISIFSDDDIQKIQTAALQFGLTTEEVKKLTPAIIDFASATGQDLATAMDSVLRGIEGQARGLKIYGISLEEGATKAENLAEITEQLNTKFKGQADVVRNTTAGSIEFLGNKYDDLKEEIGGAIDGMVEVLAIAAATALNGFKPLGDSLDSTTEKLARTRQEIQRVQRGLNSLNISILTNQIKQLSAADQDVTKLTERLDKLKGINIAVDIEGLDDKKLSALKTELEALKKQSQGGVNLFYINPDNVAKLKAVDAELQKRHLDEIVRLEDISKLTTAQLNQRRDELKKLNTISADDAIAAIDKELIAREKAHQRALENARRAADEQARLTKEIFDHQQQLNRESAAETSKLQVLALKNQEQLEIQAINEAYAAKGDFTKESEIKLSQDLLRIRISYLEKEALLFEDDKVKQAEIANQILTVKGNLYAKDVELAKIAIDQKLKDEEEAAQKKIELQQKVFDTLSEASNLFSQLADNFAASSQRQIDAINEQLEVQLDAYDQDAKANEDGFQRKTITEIEYRRKQQEILKQKELAEAEAARKTAELRKKEYTAKKIAAMFEIVVNTAAAVTEALPIIPLSILVGALGLAQLAFVAAQPVPKFAKGTLSVPGTGTSDTVHAMLTPGEAVIPRDKSLAYRPSISAMFHGKISPKDMNDLVNWKINGGVINQTAASIDYEKLASAMVWHMNIHGKKGVKILNVEDFAPLFNGGAFKRGLS